MVLSIARKLNECSRARPSSRSSDAPYTFALTVHLYTVADRVLVVDFKPLFQRPDLDRALFDCARRWPRRGRRLARCNTDQEAAFRRYVDAWNATASVTCSGRSLNEFESCMAAHPRQAFEDAYLVCSEKWVSTLRPDFVEAMLCVDAVDATRAAGAR